MIFDIVHGTNAGRSNAISCTDLVNFYPEIEDGSKSKYVKSLIGCPGYRLAVAAYTSGYCRALYTTSTGSRMFSVIENKLIEITSAEIAVDRGTISTSTGMCGICDNGSQVLIVDGSNGYIFTLGTNALVSITDADFPDYPTHCIFNKGYFIVNNSGSGQFYFSSSYDGTAWHGLDFATAEYSADTLQGIIKTSNGTIWMVGSQSVELWQSVESADLPWQAIFGAVKEYGCIAPYSIASNGSQVFFVGNGQNGYASVFMGNGYEISKISTPAIEYQIKQFVGIGNATAFVYSDEGHSFYVLNFTSEKTLVYDLSSGEWHRRASFNAQSGTNLRQFSQGCCFFNGKLYVGSYQSGNIYEMSLDIYSEAGESIKREIATNYISSENELLRHMSVEMDMETGVGLVGGVSPTVSMRFSDDLNKTLSNSITATPGKIGEYLERVIFKRLGRSRKRSYNFIFTDSVKWVINSLFVKVG
jgi:hypothetical protein